MHQAQGSAGQTWYDHYPERRQSRPVGQGEAVQQFFQLKFQFSTYLFQYFIQGSPDTG